MPEYRFTCPLGHTVDLQLDASHRDDAQQCALHLKRLTRVFVFPMAIQWAGKFGNRWAKVRDGDW